MFVLISVRSLTPHAHCPSLLPPLSDTFAIGAPGYGSGRASVFKKCAPGTGTGLDDSWCLQGELTPDGATYGVEQIGQSVAVSEDNKWVSRSHSLHDSLLHDSNTLALGAPKVWKLCNIDMLTSLC